MSTNNTTSEYYTKKFYLIHYFPSALATNKNSLHDEQKYIHYMINTYLYTLLYSDYREYLNLANIITSRYESKVDFLSNETPLPDEFDFLKKDICKINSILFKGEYRNIQGISMKDLNITIEDADKFWEWSAGILIISLFQQMIRDKKNFNGLINTIHENKFEISSKLSTEIIREIKQISTDNRKRSKTYTRGCNETNNKPSTYLFLSIISFLIIGFILFLILNS